MSFLSAPDFVGFKLIGVRELQADHAIKEMLHCIANIFGYSWYLKINIESPSSVRRGAILRPCRYWINFSGRQAHFKCIELWASSGNVWLRYSG